MRRTGNRNRTPWYLQDLREQSILARAEQVKLERTIRDALRDPRNRGTVLTDRVPGYADPADAVSDLRAVVGRMAYLARPGLRNRVKPEVLLGRYESAVAVAAAMADQLAAAEKRYGSSAYSDDAVPVMARHVDWLWNFAPVPPEIRTAAWTRNALVRSGYVTVAALTGATEQELAEIRNFGDGCMEEVRRVLDAHGLGLAGD